MKNTSLHSGMKRSPYEAMFGGKPKIGLKTSNIPLEAMDYAATEEDLENVVKSIPTDNAQTEQLLSQQPAMDNVTTEEDLEEFVTSTGSDALTDQSHSQ